VVDTTNVDTDEKPASVKRPKNDILVVAIADFVAANAKYNDSLFTNII
jgi:hypothetical protein